jgi:hypothetical protein
MISSIVVIPSQGGCRKTNARSPFYAPQIDPRPRKENLKGKGELEERRLPVDMERKRKKKNQIREPRRFFLHTTVGDSVLKPQTLPMTN